MALVIIWAASIAAQDGPVADGKKNTAAVPAESELVHYGDLIEVDVAGIREYDWRGSISPEGFLEGYQVSGESFFGLCKSPAEISTEIAAALSGTVKKPQVIVSILDRSGRPLVSLTGAVRSPQRFQLRRPITLRELIVLSGGITDRASGGIQIFRPSDVGCSELRGAASKDSPIRGGSGQFLDVSVFDLVAGRAGSDFKVLSGDLVTVIEALPVFVLGGVSSPGRMFTNTETTVSRAVASAGGLTRTADPRSVRIFRRGAPSVSVIEVDLEKIKTGSVPDVPLKPYDVVEVAERGGKRLGAPGEVPPIAGLGESGRKNASELPVRIVD